MSNAQGVSANPEALNAIVKAGEKYSIVASQDIIDTNGMKLLARGQPVSQALTQRLLERKLAQPLESCLNADDGVTLFTLREQLESLLSQEGPAKLLLQVHADMLLQQTERLPLHSVAQLLLTASFANRPTTLPHAVLCMALSGALAASREKAGADASSAVIRMAMLGGLLHDLGEIYIQPQYLDYSGPMGVTGHKHLMVHPRLAQMMLENTTDYPKALTRAIGEHPRAADTVGIDVYRIRYGAVIASGMLAAAGGAFLSIGFVNSFNENMTAGRGFIALAAVIFGNWRPFGAAAACLLFGFSSALAQRLPEYSESAAVLFQALPYVLTLIAVAGVIGRSVPPAADGRPYQKQ